MAAALVPAAVGCSGDDPRPRCLHFLRYGGCSSSEAWETRVNNGSAKTEERGRTLWESCPFGEDSVAWSRKGSKAVLEEGSREYKTHELTTINGCVMMGMGRAAGTDTKPERVTYVISKWDAVEGDQNF